MTPKISVVMPVYNEEKFLEKAIESILNQTFTDFEFIIIDDGSIDDSSKIIKSFNDTRIKFFQSENKGMVNQFNFGIVNSSSPLIARMDADDIAEENRFEIQLNTLLEHPEIQVIGSNVLFIDENDSPICEKRYPEFHKEIEFMMPIESSVCHPSVIIRKEIFDKIGFYKSDYDYAADHELFLNLVYHGYKFYNVQQTLLKYRPRFMRSDKSRMEDSNAISYRLGIDYLSNLDINSSSKQIKYSYYFRMGLLEYYRGSISNSRRYFFKAALNKKLKILKILRYLIVSILGQKNIVRLREKNILPRISLYINKVFKLDLHRIKY